MVSKSVLGAHELPWAPSSVQQRFRVPHPQSVVHGGLIYHRVDRSGSDDVLIRLENPLRIHGSWYIHLHEWLISMINV